MLPFDEEQQSLNKSPLDETTLLSGQFWGELRVFLAVAKTKSFNRAAEMTNTSQPTVSRQAKRLQDVVGSQLFISTPRGVTQKGEALAHALSRLDYTLHTSTSDLKSAQAPCLFGGYVGDTERTAELLSADGFATGNLACLTELGNLQMSGRDDDVFKVEGKKVSCLPIASALLATCCLRIWP
jgi:acyl-CoA synthetase (AMP-forming)/AMP-acid ligase II